MARIQLHNLNYVIPLGDIETPAPTEAYVWSVFLPWVGLMMSTGCWGAWFKANLMIYISAIISLLLQEYGMWIFLHSLAMLSAMATIKYYNWTIKYEFADEPKGAALREAETIKKDVEHISKTTKKHIRRLKRKTSTLETSIASALATLSTDVLQLQCMTADITERTTKLEDTSSILYSDFVQRNGTQVVTEDDYHYDSEERELDDLDL